MHVYRVVLLNEVYLDVFRILLLIRLHDALPDCTNNHLRRGVNSHELHIALQGGLPLVVAISRSRGILRSIPVSLQSNLLLFGAINDAIFELFALFWIHAYCKLCVYAYYRHGRVYRQFYFYSKDLRFD